MISALNLPNAMKYDLPLNICDNKKLDDCQTARIFVTKYFYDICSHASFNMSENSIFHMHVLELKYLLRIWKIWKLSYVQLKA